MTIKRLFIILILIGTIFSTTACRSGDGLQSGADLSSEEARGASLYEERCVRCHIVNGVGGKLGPDLSHIGSKRDADWLKKFTQNPKSVDPANKMPQVFLRPEELTAVVKYMQTLD